MSNQGNLIWDEVVAAAVMGTERRPFTPPNLPGRLGEMASMLDQSFQERHILALAAAIVTWDNAGRLPAVSDQPDSVPCEDDITPCIGRSADQLFKRIPDGEYSELLPEFLKAVADQGKRVPENRLPALLDMGQKNRALRKLILPVIGKRGIWLAQRNPEWGFAVGASDEANWETGSLESRTLLLRELRSREPGKARELLISTWSEEPYAERAAFLESFDIGLSMNDESFLEEALDDRRKEVRAVAARLLSALPDSGFCKRMINRVSPFVNYSLEKGGFLSLGRKTGNLHVSIPEELDKSASRDGIEKKPPTGIGEKAWWLQQMIATIPPTHWCKAWEASPEDIVEAALRTEWKSALIHGFAEAAARNHNADWADVLLALPRAEIVQQRGSLLRMLPDQKAESIVMRIIKSERLVDIFYLLDRPWTHDFSISWLSPAWTSANNRLPEYEKRHICKWAACRVSPSVRYIAEERLSPYNSEPHIAEFLAEVQFRHDLHEAIKASE